MLKQRYQLIVSLIFLQLVWNASLAATASAAADNPASKATIGDDGTVHFPAFDLPFSSVTSSGAAEYYVWKHRIMAEAGKSSDPSYFNKHFYAPLIEKAKSRYPVNIKPQT